MSVARGNPIDSPPAHPDTVLTTLVHAEQFLRQQGTNITHLVADIYIQSCIADQIVRSRKAERARTAYVDVVHRLHRRTGEGHRAGTPVGLLIRRCAEHDERQGIASTSHGDNCTVRRSPLQRYHRSELAG